ncbi:MAG: TfoX/Sxy family protein [Gemmatimonas sp.]
MSVSDGFSTFIIDALSRSLADVRSRKMFGGVGLYSGELFFALLDNDTLYFKVDDDTRPDFEAIGMGPFRPFGDGGETMQYYEVSADLIENEDDLALWAERAVSVARRAKARRPRKKANKKVNKKAK